MHLTTVVTALICSIRKRTQFIATDMLLFGALKSSKNGVCSYTISRLCLFQAVLLLTQHYIMHLTTILTALMCYNRKQTQFIATDMSLFGAFTSSKYGVCSDTISRQCVFQAVLLLTQHYIMHLTTVVTALMRGSRKRTQFIATDMSLFGALKSSKNGLCSDTISRLCVFQAVLLLAKH
jgi:hypothetical protein